MLQSPRDALAQSFEEISKVALVLLFQVDGLRENFRSRNSLMVFMPRYPPNLNRSRLSWLLSE